MTGFPKSLDNPNVPRRGLLARAFFAVQDLNEDERLKVISHFCRGCGLFLDDGETCNCQNDKGDQQ